MASRNLKKPNRRSVPCECSACGGVQHVSQETRRTHLQREREALFAAYSALFPVRPAPTADVSSGSAEVGPANRARPSTPPPSEHPPSPTTPTHTSDLAPPPGTPIGARRAAALFAQECRAATLIADALANPDDENREGDPLEPLMDDNWEDPTEADTDVDPPLPVHPDPVLIEPEEFQPPVARGIPDVKLAENTPDPFYQPQQSSGPSAPTTFSDVHEHPGIYLLYLLVSWLHLQFHLPFRACTAAMNVFLIILQAFGNVVSPTPITTLPRIMNKLDVEPTFNVLPVCPRCLEVFPSSSSTPTICPCCHTFIFKATTGTATQSNNRVPLLRYPSKSLESQLASLLAVPGIEAALDNWRSTPRRDGLYVDVFDGRIPQTLQDPTGQRFFRNGPSERDKGPNGELRIALTLGVDWFSYLRSQIAPSHSSCPISFNIANLPPHLRYRTANLLLCGIMPGPKEQDPDQVHRFLRILVNELLRLWQEGVVIVTPSSPEGRLIRVILIAICCDKPAAHKLGGFGSHSHTFFCTMCWIKQADKGSPKAYEKNGFRARTDEEHCAAGARYTNCTSSSARDDFVKLNAARWSEFARLPYFDLVCMVVIDPMHNLILGLVKTHFYHIWVQGKILRKTKELQALHGILHDIKLPPYLGRLPSLMGIPAGGSLTADQWLLMATVVAPLAIPQIWHDYMLNPDEAREQRAKANQARVICKERAAQAQRQRAAARRAQQEPPPVNPTPESSSTSQQNVSGTKRARVGATEANDDDDEDESLPSCLHPDDLANFLKLSRALNILIAREITDEQINEAEILLQEYCKELIQLYGPDVMRPNHHYAIHTPEFVRDFGLLHGFWTFLFERLNKVLKSYKTNNHGGGELETTFFREFHRTVLTSRAVARSSGPGQPEFFKAAVSAMFDASADDRGTVQALAHELDTANEDDGIIFAFSPRYKTKHLPIDLYHAVLRYLTRLFPLLRLCSCIDLEPPAQSLPLQRKASFFDYAIIRQHRYQAFNRSSGESPGSLVEVIISERGDTWAGKLLDLIHIHQQDELIFSLGHFRWFRPLRMDLRHTVWQAFLPIGVKIWHDGQHLHESEPGPPPFLPLQYIKNHIARYEIVINEVPAWATVSIGKK